MTVFYSVKAPEGQYLSFESVAKTENGEGEFLAASGTSVNLSASSSYDGSQWWELIAINDSYDLYRIRQKYSELYLIYDSTSGGVTLSDPPRTVRICGR